MNDPGIQTLHYRFVSESPTDMFIQAAPLNVTLGGFEVVLKDDRLMATPGRQYPSEASARNALEPLLRAWEESALLDSCLIRFEFLNADLIDSECASGDNVVYMKSSLSLATTFRATLTLQHGKYPAPNPGFASSELTAKLTNRFRRFKDQAEPLCSMGYWVLSLLETTFGCRKNVASTLRIEEEILRVFGDLTAVDDPIHGRKTNPKEFRSTLLRSQNRSLHAPLCPKEVQWIEATVVLLIRRVGEHNANPSGYARLTMRDLPNI